MYFRLAEEIAGDKVTGVKSRKFLTGVFIFVFCASSAVADTESISTNAITIQIATAMGWQLAHDKEVNGIEINESELTNFVAGFSLGTQDRELSLDMRQISPDVDALAKVRQQKVIEGIERQCAREAETFLTKWKNSATVVELPDEVRYEIIRSGGITAQARQTVKVHYVARLVNGAIHSEFGPDDLILVTNHLNRGLFEGFQKMGVGGKMRLYLPPALTEHEIEMAGVQRGSALVYEVEMLGVRDTPANELADALVPAAPESPPSAYSGRFATNDVIKAWGWEIAQQSRLWKLSLNQNELTGLAKGFEAGVRGTVLSTEAEHARPLVDQFIGERKQEFEEAFRQKQMAAMASLFADLDQNTNVVKSADGLRYEILKPGSGAFPRTGQIVLVNYTARALGGNVFDQTANEPLHVEVGRVIRGWNEGIQKIGAGGQVKLYIPPSLAYGSDAVSGIPAYSTLIYDIELLRIEDTAEK
jgi:FKBP-type peptidyl-prolyl cis-trans isomerase